MVKHRHSPETREKQRRGALRMWARRTGGTRKNIRDIISDRATERYLKLRLITNNDPACINCAYWHSDHNMVGECRKYSPPFEITPFDTFCSECITVVSNPPEDEIRRLDPVPVV